MTEVTKETELAVRLPTGLQEMGRLIAAVGVSRVETLACCSYHERDSAVVLLVTSDPVRTGAELSAANFCVAATEVVVVHANYEPWLAMQLNQQLSAAGISTLYSYASRTEGRQAYLVFRTTDNDRAVSLLRAKLLVQEVALAKTVVPTMDTVEHVAA